jgi:hypothetical protein
METVIREDNLDIKIKDIVIILRKYGFETFESCEGGDGHCFFFFFFFFFFFLSQQ